MEEVSIVCVDPAKQVFQIHGAAADGRILFRKKLSRSQFPRFIAGLRRVWLRWRHMARCIIGVESLQT